MNGAAPQPKLWTAEHLASYLGVPVSWIYKRTRIDGPQRIPHIKLGKYLRFNPASAAFQRWLEGHERGGENEQLTPNIARFRVGA